MIIKLVHNVSTPLAPGKYHYRATVGNGAATLEIGDELGGFQTMINGEFTTDSDGTMYASKFPVRAQLTGTAEIRLSKLPDGV